MIRVVIIDDHVVVRAGLRYIIEANPELEFAGEFGGGIGAVEFVAEKDPDVVLLDVRMPDRGGIDVLRDLLKANPSRRVVMLTTSDVEEDVFQAIEEGAFGYVMKESPVETISAAILSAHGGEVFMTDEVRRIYETRKNSKGLSSREAEVLALCAKGSGNREIAKEMGLSENSVKMFLKRAFFKLGASNRAEAVQLAVRRGLINGFTLVELLITVAVIAILMSFTLRFGNIAGDYQARSVTISRMQRLENAISGYYAAFGTYPPVSNFNSPNIYLKVSRHGIQSEDEENTALWGWLDGKGEVKNGGAEREAWKQVKAACESQPVACAYPYRTGDREFVEYYSEQMKAFAQQASEEEFTDSDKREVFLKGFDIGIPSGRFSKCRDKVKWSEIQLFKFGLLSFLLPRYLFMMQCPQDMLSFNQWTGNNEIPSSPWTGTKFNDWESMQDQANDDDDSPRKAEIASIPSQAVCARWMPNFERQLSCTSDLKFYGISVKGADEKDQINLNEINLDLTIYSPGGYDDDSTDGQYVLNTVTIKDGWGNEFYYYSPEPYQSYQLWSAGPNGRTFPPWISRGSLDSDAQKCTGYWIQDDIVGLRN